MSRRIGFHVSIEGGLSRAVERAADRGCTCLQVFCGNPRAWAFAERSRGELEEFHDARADAGLAPLFVHACYLINPCASDPDVLRRSMRRMAQELALSAEMGADGYVLHPGSHKGRPADWGVARAAEAIGRAVARAGRAPMVLLENTASPHGPGGRMETLGRLVERIGAEAPGVPVGLAVDSCHAFGAGYDLRNADEVARLVREVDCCVGRERLRLLHVNDSRDEPGSHRDRHEHIGRGTIGKEGLSNLLNHPDLSTLPLVLETPWESAEQDRRNLAAVRAILSEE
jgi:deoxyribonuclease-4